MSIYIDGNVIDDSFIDNMTLEQALNIYKVHGYAIQVHDGKIESINYGESKYRFTVPFIY